MNWSLPDSSVHGVSRQEYLSGFTFPSSWLRDCTCISCFGRWILYHWASRQEYWGGLPCPSAGDLPDWGIESRPPALQVHSLPPEPPGNPEFFRRPLIMLSHNANKENQAHYVKISQKYIVWFFFFFWLGWAAYGILVPRPGIEPVFPTVIAWSLNHWSTRKVPKYDLIFC